MVVDMEEGNHPVPKMLMVVDTAVNLPDRRTLMREAMVGGRLGLTMLMGLGDWRRRRCQNTGEL